jgi:hypothetical protein
MAFVCLCGCAPVVLPPADGGSPALTSFAFLTPTAQATIAEEERTVRLEVPSGTDLSALVAVYVASGARVTVAGVDQVSGRTANNFSNPVEYVVAGSDGSSATYVVRVSVRAPLAQEKSITEFAFREPTVNATIDETRHSIAAVVPHGTDRSSLVAVFLSTGIRVTVDDTEQVSGVTINDFVEPRTYVVTAEDGSSSSYIVEVQEAPGAEKCLTSFSLLCPGATAVIDEAQRIVHARVADGTGLSSLVAEFSITGASVRVAGRVQQSGITANDFTSPVEYEVIAEDGTSVVYTVKVVAGLALLVNEVDVDQVGVDNSEFIELLAVENVDLWGIVVILLNGSVTPGLEYARIDLSALGALVQGSYLVLAGPLVQVLPPALKHTPPGWESSNRIQNGPSDAVMIWDTIGRKVIDTVSYAGVLHRALITGEQAELDATEGSSGAAADSNSAIGSMARFPNGHDTGQNGIDFRFTPVLTPGGPNP